ncbi:MAG: WGR domain-containing protein [Nitrososphaera sp.]|nr:WGR domain-containing protein [Nitrososphaera sp.]
MKEWIIESLDNDFPFTKVWTSWFEVGTNHRERMKPRTLNEAVECFSGDPSFKDKTYNGRSRLRNVNTGEIIPCEIFG